MNSRAAETAEPRTSVPAPPPLSVPARLLLLLVRLYQLTLAWLLGGHCRFVPSCSNYAIGAIENLGAYQGALHAARRVCKCHPFHPGGYDPPPPRPAPPLSQR